ncbi:uncharacterized protein LOC128120448 [Peromyscus californicus insignis]|uniref:uncharacterized protein LOC128120448 n=1 Tax=Peromyscus californicus insignis TaxID=564181 RepID=UPI0022A78287|nr:uncharacterized protein LOC128120448 [Peromyscus californicus insignis]XP_052610424.1 uncharacterized protein LOC128120448 [Peromyscus californicus insignis]
MGNKASNPVSPSSPLGCLVEALKPLSLMPYIKIPKITHLCSKKWPKYALENNKKWPPSGSLDPDILRELSNYCQRSGRWQELPYVIAFFFLSAKPSLLDSFSPAHMLLAMPEPEDSLTPESLTLDPANEPPPIQPPAPTPRKTVPSAPLPDSSSSKAAPSSAAAGSKGPALAPNFTPPTTRSWAAKLPDSSHPKPSTVLPLREVAGVDGLIKVHVPFSLAELSQIESKLGSYTSNSAAFIKQFQYITQSYSLTFHDIFMILSNNLLPEERRRVWEQARIHADEIHQTNLSHPPGTEAVPDREPHWDYNTQGGCLARDRFITCLLTGLCKAALKPVNYEKLKMVIQDKDENPSHFLEWLTKALLQFTSLDPESPEGRQLLMTHFVSQSFPDIRDKLKRLENGPLTPQADVPVIAFKVFHGRDEKAHKRSCQMLASTVRPAPRKPSGPCFKCGREGHWAQACTTGP